MQCYFKGDSQAQFHSKLFTFVDFGPNANAFLSACGVKNEPSVEEIAKILLDNPRQFYDLAEGREKYVCFCLRPFEWELNTYPTATSLNCATYL